MGNLGTQNNLSEMFVFIGTIKLRTWYDPKNTKIKQRAEVTYTVSSNHLLLREKGSSESLYKVHMKTWSWKSAQLPGTKD